MSEALIEPPIVFRDASGALRSLSTVEQLIDFLRRQRHEPWSELRDAAFVAAALPSRENIETLRRLAEAALRGP